MHLTPTMATSDTDTTHGYTENREAVLKRLRRIEGQVRGVERMVEENRYCIDVVTQVTAIQAALDKVALELLSDHAAHCVVGAEGDRTARAHRGADGRGQAPLRSAERYSYWRDSRTSSRDARRAGGIAASTPIRAAKTSSTISEPTG